MSESYLKAVIIDDEQHAIDLFKHVLRLFENNIQLCGEALDLIDGLKMINEKKPDLVFLDIEMPNYSGLQIRDLLPDQLKTEIIYVTAHTEYAIQALRLEVSDYLLKPVDKTALQECFERVTRKLKMQNEKPATVDKKENSKKIAVNTHQGTYYMDTCDIIFLEASSMYCVIHTKNDQIVVSKPLGDFEETVGDKFFRVHRSYLVNTKFIKKLSVSDGNELELTNGKKIPVSRSRKEAFRNFMKQL